METEANRGFMGQSRVVLEVGEKTAMDVSPMEPVHDTISILESVVPSDVDCDINAVADDRGRAPPLGPSREAGIPRSGRLNVNLRGHMT